MMSNWIDYAFWTALHIAFVVGIFDATRQLILIGPRKKEVLTLAALTLASIAFGAAYYWMHLTTVELVTGFAKKSYVQFATDWASDQPPEAREKGSRSYASAAYLGGGVVLKYVDITGRWGEFRPSQEQITERESAVATQAQMEELSREFAKIAGTWWLGCLFAAAFGWLEAWQTRRRNPGS